MNRQPVQDFSPSLSKIEMVILDDLVRGYTDWAIAQRQGMGLRTVQIHVSSLYAKLLGQNIISLNQTTCARTICFRARLVSEAFLQGIITVQSLRMNFGTPTAIMPISGPPTPTVGKTEGTTTSERSL